MRVVLCCMAKNEHKYINDFVSWYLNIGFDQIYIYDNDDNDAEHIENYINAENRKKVKIFNIRGMKGQCLQHTVYTTFYQKHRTEFDWCLFCDVDEFLFGVKDIKAFLSQPYFYNIQQIRVKWKLFGDDNLITRDMSKPVYEVFHKEIAKSYSRDSQREKKLYNQGKSFVRGNLIGVVVNSVHYASNVSNNQVLSSALPSGRPCNSFIEIKEDYSHEKVFLNHYMTKSLSEFLEQKLGRNDAVFNTNVPLDYYWRVNEKTEEKINYLKEKGFVK